jgi:hypothetical protein
MQSFPGLGGGGSIDKGEIEASGNGTREKAQPATVLTTAAAGSVPVPQDRLFFSRLNPNHTIPRSLLLESACDESIVGGVSADDVDELLRVAPYTDQLYFEQYLRIVAPHLRNNLKPNFSPGATNINGQGYIQSSNMSSGTSVPQSMSINRGADTVSVNNPPRSIVHDAMGSKYSGSISGSTRSLMSSAPSAILRLDSDDSERESPSSDKSSILGYYDSAVDGAVRLLERVGSSVGMISSGDKGRAVTEESQVEEFEP